MLNFYEGMVQILKLMQRHEKILMDLGDFMGETMLVDPLYKYIPKRAGAKVLVNFHLLEVLADNVEIKVRDTILQ